MSVAAGRSGAGVHVAVCCDHPGCAVQVAAPSEPEAWRRAKAVGFVRAWVRATRGRLAMKDLCPTHAGRAL